MHHSEHAVFGLLCLCSTKSDGKLASLDQYISRMKPGQKDIFYITGNSKEQLEKSPFLERLTKKNYEVLLEKRDTCFASPSLVWAYSFPEGAILGL